MQKNYLRKVDDNQTFFHHDLSLLDLSNNLIQQVNFERTEYIFELQLSQNLLSGNAIATTTWPNRVGFLYLAGNPIGSLSNTAFAVDKALDLSNCGILELTNVHFIANRVILDDNPLELFKNVTFENVQRIFMQRCNLTTERFKSILKEITIINKYHHTILALQDNAINNELDDVSEFVFSSGQRAFFDL